MSTVEIQSRGGNLATHRWVNAGAMLLAAGLVLTMLAGVFLRPMYLDERANLNYLWLIGQGERPYQDFWCTYPVAGYVFYLPIFKLLPEQAGVVIVLRVVSVLLLIASVAVVCLWSRKLSGCWWLPLFPATFVVHAKGPFQDGLARVLTEYRLDAPALLLAFISIALLFGDARGRKRVLAVACAVVSLAVMPKYAYVLIACHVLDLIGRWFGRRLTSRTILETTGGGLLGLLLAWAMTAAMHASLADVWRWSFLLHAQYQAQASLSANFEHWFFRGLLVPFIQKDLWASISLAAGMVGFMIWAKRQGWRDQRAWVGYGLLLGVAVMTVRTVYPFNQYLPQVLLPLLFLFPFVWPVISHGSRGVLVQWALLVVMAMALLVIGRNEARDFAVSKLYIDLDEENTLLAKVPADEKVLGNFPLVFRKPFAFVTYDEIWGEPPGFGHLVQDNPTVAREFTPERLREILQQSRPALIHVTLSFPPGWMAVVEDYLQKNQQHYQRVDFDPSSDIRNDAFYIRADLVE